jgi:hypothetical protein
MDLFKFTMLDVAGLTTIVLLGLVLVYHRAGAPARGARLMK